MRGGGRGYTLIEMVMTIALTAFVIVGLFSVFQTQHKAAVDQRNYLVALNLARQRMAITLNEPYPAVSAETALSTDSDYPGFIATREVVSVDTSGSESLREIRIRVRLGSDTGPVLMQLHTYRTSVVTFGDGT